MYQAAVARPPRLRRYIFARVNKLWSAWHNFVTETNSTLLLMLLVTTPRRERATPPESGGESTPPPRRARSGSPPQKMRRGGALSDGVVEQWSHGWLAVG